jgi:hypothetical protein
METTLLKKIFFLLVLVSFCCFSLLLLSSQFSDPYSKQSTVNLTSPKVSNTSLLKLFSFFKSGVRIASYSLFWKEKPFTGTHDEIIAKIHAERFNPDKPYVITGGHYSDLYVRNMGVFYNVLLEPDFASSSADLQNRQRIALNTVELNLAYLEQSPEPVTTIAPLGGDRVTGLNIYAYPSDSIYGIVFTLSQLQKSADTAPASTELLNTHKTALSAALNHYIETIIDPDTGLVRKDLSLASARDGVKRSSSFYDNVIAWATVQLADELGVPHSPTLPAEEWKQKIITTYWRPDVGIFTDQITDTQPTFSADTLIVTSTGFLDTHNETDAAYLAAVISYIDKESLDEPFPLRYSSSDSTTFQPIVGLFAPKYMTSGIWSHWGMEYIKALALLAENEQNLTKKDAYYKEACRHLESYKQNISKYGGYPELYNDDGTIFSSPFVNSVLHSGWVVNYEYAQWQLTGHCVDSHTVYTL